MDNEMENDCLLVDKNEGSQVELAMFSDKSSFREFSLFSHESQQSRRKITITAPLALHITLFLCNLVIGTAVIYARYHIPGVQYSKFEYSPLRDIVEYRADFWNLTLGQRTEYTQSPNDEVDAAWNRISAPPGDVGLVLASQDEMDRVNITSVPAKDGSGYLVAIDVFHQLHCLDFLRRNIYAARYYDSDHDPYHMRDEHIAHCLDSIRLSLQCHADLSLIPFTWSPDHRIPWPEFHTTHQCRNFDEILAFSQRNMFHAKEHMDLFVNPLLSSHKEVSTGGPEPSREAMEGSRS